MLAAGITYSTARISGGREKRRMGESTTGSIFIGLNRHEHCRASRITILKKGQERNPGAGEGAALA